jgi:hypothetical protein
MSARRPDSLDETRRLRLIVTDRNNPGRSNALSFSNGEPAGHNSPDRP